MQAPAKKYLADNTVKVIVVLTVHAGDSTRVELIIPGEQHFYLKAVNVAERQRWLVALGSSKACLTDSRTRKEKEINENTECLKKKVSELRLYCDLLLHQVNTLKENAQSDQSMSTNLEIDMATVLRSTCNTFMKTLEECMQIANASFRPELLEPTTPDSPHVAVVKPNRIKQRPPSYNCRERNELKNCQNGLMIKENKIKSWKRSQLEKDDHRQGTSKTGSVENAEVMTDNSELADTAAEDSSVNIELQPSAAEEKSGQGNEEPGGTNPISDVEKEEIQTFFSAMDQRFNDIEFEEDNGIPTLPFLESCYAIVPVLDKLGPTVFAPVKLDFVGNIKKINQKYITDTTKFTTLQKIVLHELETEVATVRNSATEALLWLKRGLKFLKGFLEEVNNGEKDIQKALNASYGRTLRQYHGWVVRGVFALALRAAPFYEAFMAALAITEGDEQKEAFYEGMQRDLNQYLPAMGKQIEILDALYEEYNLESDEVV
ncbi:pleckstrin homology domain-containing family A member 8 [Pristis pectinata]|uniref:pleckstrin homology domain-containing family A member 8 n=1 Tax=Pristis pectinata TaxID=685728 RepID=UPI00223DBF0A|nr:pleckstrin homology domain-containing family A member 8 [Pristis pectinata]